MKQLLSNKLLLVFVAVLVLTMIALIAAYMGDMYGLRNLAFKDVTTNQLASAMREDRFWYTYRENTLIFSGTIISLNQQPGRVVVGLRTTDSYGVSCELASGNGNLKIGRTLKFEAETYQAERQPSGVLLHQCINP